MHHRWRRAGGGRSPASVALAALQRIGAACLVCLAAACTHSGVPAPVEERGANEGWSPPLYRVARGDTLYAIAWRYDLDFRDLARWNGLAPPYSIQAGETLALGPGTPRAAPRRATATPPQPVRQSAPAPAAPQRAQAKPAARSDAPEPAQPLPTGPLRWQWPSTGTPIAEFSPQLGQNRGINIAGRRGDPVHAAAAGRVVYAGDGLPRYGNLLIIKHDDTYLSAYAHCSALAVREGEQVQGGQRIAAMGDSGAERVMLHFEIRRNGKPVDPRSVLPPR